MWYFQSFWEGKNKNVEWLCRETEQENCAIRLMLALRRVSEVKMMYQNGQHSEEAAEEPDNIVANGGAVVVVLMYPSNPSCPSHDAPVPLWQTKMSFDEVLFDFRSVAPEDIAAQLTLIDLELFRAIGLEEFTDGKWTKKDKCRLAPNIVAFTTRFNHTSFWVVKVILTEKVVKIRAEILTQFIRVAKKLLELNNIHSLKAVVAGLQSAAVYRLSQTWKLVPKKEKAAFDKKQLREHMNAAKLPCIPFLGMYLTDLVYLDTVLAQSVTRQSQAQVETIMNTIAFCQNSSYDNLSPKPHIIGYLDSVKYIDELQKFLEDDNFKQSLRLEPTEATRQKEAAETSVTLDLLSHPLRVTKSQEDLLTPDAEPVIPPKFSTPSSSKHAQPKVWDRSHSSFGLGGSSPSASKKSTTMPRLAMEHKQPSSGALGGGELPPPPHSSSSLHVLLETPEKKKFLSSPWRGHKKSKSVGTK
ncbi:hypothetical protein EMCRGX_G021016 [Ephydatia muelleri]